MRGMRSWLRGILVTVTLVASGQLALSCGDDDGAPAIDPGDGGKYVPEIDPSRFVERIDNRYLPLQPGARWIYESEDGSERIEVEVLPDVRTVMGIAATVVRDRASEDGQLVEETFDWFAQDADGNVWYLGEDSKEYEDGEVASTSGSWEAGVDGALPGIIMPASPTLGRAYRQEYYDGEAEDMAEVVRLDGRATVPFGTYDTLLVTREWTPLEPDVVEQKYYAEGIGPVLEETLEGGEGRLLLVSYTPGR